MDNELRPADRSPLQRRAVLTTQWDSLESNTDNLAQESKQHLQMHTDEYMLCQGKILKGEDWEDAIAGDTNEDFLLSDSIEVSAQPHTKRKPVIDTHISQLDTYDSYSELCCNPNWRINKEGDAMNSAQKRHYSSSPLQKPFIGEYRYISDTSSAMVLTPNIAGNQCQPYHLHPQDDYVSSIKTFHMPLGDISPKRSSSSISTKANSDNTSHRQFKETLQNRCHLDENVNRSLELTEHSMHLKEYKTDNQNDLKHIPGELVPISPTTESPKTLRKKKRQIQREDLVRRNKITLGRIAPGNGSYVNMHALKQKRPHAVKETAEEGHIAECPKDSLDLELGLIQKTHQLKVTNFTEESEAQGNMEPYYRSTEKSPECTTASKCQFSGMDSEQKCCLEESAKTTDSLHGHSFDGCLAPMDHQTRAKPNYKAYSLNEYKELKLDVNLRGLGPDYMAVKKSAEKMKQQKQYSNGVRERNKNLSKIPFIMAKDPVVKDKRIARIKALEYAKTIAKPLVQPQSKSSHNQQSGGSTGHTTSFKDWDIAHLATVDLLMKRHQEEKDAVFRKVQFT
nr:uncharacterized protein LOC133607372 [Nerophis lumbriciformis]